MPSSLPAHQITTSTRWPCPTRLPMPTQINSSHNSASNIAVCAPRVSRVQAVARSCSQADCALAKDSTHKTVDRHSKSPPVYPAQRAALLSKPATLSR